MSSCPLPLPRKNKTQPPATEPLIGALRSVSSVITSPPPSSPQNAMLFGVLQFPETVALRKDQRKIDRFPQKTTPRFKNNSGRRPRSAAAPVALALLHRGYHQETKESGKKKSGNARKPSPRRGERLEKRPAPLYAEAATGSVAACPPPPRSSKTLLTTAFGYPRLSISVTTPLADSRSSTARKARVMAS